MKKILLILTCFLIVQISFAQIKYDNGGIRDNSTQIGEFVVQGNSWTNSRFISYFFQNTTNDIIPQANARAAVRQAFATWQAQTRLYFVEVCNAAAADIVILWGEGNHGDNFPFDFGGTPQGNVLAHAFFPPPNNGGFAGDMHFDDFEQWTELAQAFPFQPIDLQTVALHEIGHSLGLNHTPVVNSIMEAVYVGSRRDLGADDIAGIRSIYGAPVEFINGNSFCGSSVFSINETLPAGYSVQWSATPNTITAVNNTTNGSSATISNNGFFGQATITATLTNGCGTLQFSKQVFIGPPGFGASYSNGRDNGLPVMWYDFNNTNVPNSTINNVCMGYGPYYIDASPYGTNSVTWSIVSPSNNTLTMTQTGNRATFYLTTGVGYLRATVSNGCGTYNQTFAFKPFNCNPTGGGDPCAKQASEYSIFTISPNPASDQIKIGIVSKPAPPPPCLKAAPQNKTGVGYTFSLVNIYNKLGTLEKSIKTNDATTITIPTYSLITGVYNIEIISGSYIEKKQIIIQK